MASPGRSPEQEDRIEETCGLGLEPEKLSVLVVDSNETHGRSLAAMLAPDLHDVEVVSSGEQALATLSDRFCPVIVADWGASQIEGAEFCGVLRKKNLNSYVYVILLIDSEIDPEQTREGDAAADDYLMKPVDAEALAAQLRAARRIIKLEKQLKEQNEEISRILLTDPLTGAYNRRYLNDQLPKSLEIARRYDRPLSFVICDIDHLKAVNDKYGTDAGDRVLAEFAQQLQFSLRQNVDWVVRFGGEEFILVMPETSAQAGLAAAERIRTSVMQAPFCCDEAEPIHITASFGLVAVSGSQAGQVPDMDTIIAAADHCLYQAKQAGRNKSVLTELDE